MNGSNVGYRIDIRDLDKSFGSLNVLSGINITINEGEFLAIVGRSGCGKSTLLRLISGLEKPTCGSLKVAGSEVAGVNSDVRFVFQEARLLPWKSTLDNVRHGTPNNDRDKALKALASVGLEDRAKSWPLVLSGGQTQRVALARAIAGHPKVLLLDEPMGALDALTRIEMQNLVENLWREQGFTAVLVTHDVAEAGPPGGPHHRHRRAQNRLRCPHRTAHGPGKRTPAFARFEQDILNKVLKIHVTEPEACPAPAL